MNLLDSMVSFSNLVAQFILDSFLQRNDNLGIFGLWILCCAIEESKHKNNDKMDAQPNYISRNIKILDSFLQRMRGKIIWKFLVCAYFQVSMTNECPPQNKNNNKMDAQPNYISRSIKILDSFYRGKIIRQFWSGFFVVQLNN